MVELFAGVGGFRLGLERAGWHVVWANQWEPSTKTVQHAFSCYVRHFAGDKSEHSNESISSVDAEHIPPHSLLVGGFPCQDYSVAKSLPQAHGIKGHKGVLWWDIYRILRKRQPSFVLLENVDRLLKSPASYRGRDFGIMLACLDALGYSVEWRALNAADYGFPQRRRRVFIFASRLAPGAPSEHLFTSGVLARALPISNRDARLEPILLPARPALPSLDDAAFDDVVNDWAYKLGDWELLGPKLSPFKAAGMMHDGKVWTTDVESKPGVNLNRMPCGRRRPRTLGEITRKTKVVGHKYLIPSDREEHWRSLKTARSLERRKDGFVYMYSEGGMLFPDPLDRAARTILTAEGGSGPSRFKHAVEISPGLLVRMDDGSVVEAVSLGCKYRRLVPEELEELNGFRRGWTSKLADGTPIPDTRRAFLMGNALVVGIVEQIGQIIREDAGRLCAGD